jgi:hypothetical protein
MVRRSSPGDGEYVEVPEFVIVRELGRIRDGIAVSRMTSEYILPLGGWHKDHEWVMGGRQLAYLLDSNWQSDTQWIVPCKLFDVCPWAGDCIRSGD